MNPLSIGRVVTVGHLMHLFVCHDVDVVTR